MLALAVQYLLLVDGVCFLTRRFQVSQAVFVGSPTLRSVGFPPSISPAQKGKTSIALILRTRDLNRSITREHFMHHTSAIGKLGYGVDLAHEG